ncbi:MAG: prepilin-type N-terminal cleavage/methylation domain-containing protein [Gammaproteobacteria bacterium]|mgnify:CR=1 FL=1|nr:MAG: prepilin-type N-terminal cleavage/methylation domain-containing protein [Gammaproteobacteria bacterium]
MGLKYKFQRGLTLIELSIVLMILAALAVVSTRFMFDEFDRTIADKTVAEMWAVAEYSVAYIAENNIWPDQVNNCAGAEAVMADDAGLLQGLNLVKQGSPLVTTGIESPWYNDSASDYVTYDISCSNTSPQSGFVVALTLPSFAGGQTAEEWAQYILQKLPLAQLDPGNSSRIILTMPPPSGVFALRDYLSRKPDPDRQTLNSNGQTSLNDLEAVININTDVETDPTNVQRKVVDFDAERGYDFVNDGSEDEYFDQNTAIYNLNMPRTSVFNRLILIPTAQTHPTIPSLDYPVEVDATNYSEYNCRHGSPGGFALEVCEQDYQTHVDEEDDTNEHDLPIGSAIKLAGNPRGSIKANDIYLASIAKWASEIDQEFQPDWILVQHYTQVPVTNVITYNNCTNGRSPKYEVWPKKISLEGKPANYTDVVANVDYRYSNHRHSFTVSDTGIVSIQWIVREEQDDGTGFVETDSSLPVADAYSTAYANVYCVR